MAGRKPSTPGSGSAFNAKEISQEIQKLIEQSISRGATTGMKNFMSSGVVQKLAGQLETSLSGLSKTLTNMWVKAVQTGGVSKMLDPLQKQFGSFLKFKDVLQLPDIDEFVNSFKETQTELESMAVELSGFSEASYEIERTYSSINSLMRSTVSDLEEMKETAENYGDLERKDQEAYLKNLVKTGAKLSKNAAQIRTMAAESKIKAKTDALIEAKLKAQGSHYRSNLGSFRELIKEYKKHKAVLSGGGVGSPVIGALRASAPKIQQTIGSARDFMSSIPLVGSQLSSAFGGVISGAEDMVGIFGKGGPWGIAIGLILAAFFGLDYLLAKFHKQLDDSVEGTGLFTKGWEQANQRIRKLNIAGQAAKDMRMFQMSMEDVLKVTETLTKAGVNLDQLYSKDALGVTNITRVIALTKTLGVTDDKVFSLIEDWGVDLHENMGEMLDTFSDLSTVVEKSNIGATKFWSIVGGVSNEMTVFNKNISSAGRLLSALGSSGVLTTSQLKDTLSNLATAFGKASYEQRVMFSDVMGGGEGIRKVFGVRRNVLIKQIQDALGDRAIDLNFAGNVRGQLGEGAFAQLPVELRTMINTLDTLSEAVKAQSVAGYQDFISLPETLEGLKDIAQRNGMTLDEMLKNPQNQELFNKFLQSTGMSIDTLKAIEFALKNIMEVDDNGTKVQLKNWDDLIKWTIGDGTGDGQKKRLDAIKKEIMTAAEQRAQKETSFIAQALTYFKSFESSLQSIDDVLHLRFGPKPSPAGNLKGAEDTFKKWSEGLSPAIDAQIQELQKQRLALQVQKVPLTDKRYTDIAANLVKLSEAKEKSKRFGITPKEKAQYYRQLVNQGLLPEPAFPTTPTTPATPPAAAPTPTELDKILQAQRMAESTGKMYDAAGNIITSPKGAMGIAQIMPDTAADLAKRHPELGGADKILQDQATNIQAQKLYMQELMKEFNNNTELALAAYNAGPGTVEKWQKTGQWHASQKNAMETIGYVAKIMKDLGQQPTQITQSNLFNITPGDVYTVRNSQNETTRQIASIDYAKQGGGAGSTIYGGME